MEVIKLDRTGFIRIKTLYQTDNPTEYEVEMVHPRHSEEHVWDYMTFWNEVVKIVKNIIPEGCTLYVRNGDWFRVEAPKGQTAMQLKLNWNREVNKRITPVQLGPSSRSQA